MVNPSGRVIENERTPCYFKRNAIAPAIKVDFTAFIKCAPNPYFLVKLINVITFEKLKRICACIQVQYHRYL